MDLTYPRKDSTTLRTLLPRVLTRMVQQYLSLPADVPGSLRRAAHDVAHAVVRTDATALAEALRLPTHSALLGAVLHDGDAVRDARDELDLLVLFELAATLATLAPVRIERPTHGWPALLSIRSGVRVDVGDAAASLEFATHAVTVETTRGRFTFDPRAPAWREPGPPRISGAYLPIVGDVKFALADNNPLASVQLHPEREGNALDAGGHSPEAWIAQLREAFALIEKHLPELYDEMLMLLRIIVPVGYHPERHASCSYEDALGAIYLTLHPSAMKLAEALVHEFQHNKLHAVMRLDPVLYNARTSRHRSPVRPDPRPLEGVLLAVHAFLPVSMLYRAVTEAGHPFAKSRDWPRSCEAAAKVYRDGAETLFAHGEPTKLGEALFDELRALAMGLDRRGAQN